MEVLGYIIDRAYCCCCSCCCVVVVVIDLRSNNNSNNNNNNNNKKGDRFFRVLDGSKRCSFGRKKKTGNILRNSFLCEKQFSFFFFVLNCFLVLCCVCKVFFGKRKYYVRNRQGGCDKKVLVEKGGFVTTVFFGYFEELIKISFLLGVEGQNLKGTRESFYCGFLCRKPKRIVSIL